MVTEKGKQDFYFSQSLAEKTKHQPRKLQAIHLHHRTVNHKQYLNSKVRADIFCIQICEPYVHKTQDSSQNCHGLLFSMSIAQKKYQIHIPNELSHYVMPCFPRVGIHRPIFPCGRKILSELVCLEGMFFYQSKSLCVECGSF